MVSDLIIAQLLGGLGNQMFQYAAGRALSIERGQALHLDVSGFTDYGLHQGFELARVFRSTFSTATEAEVRARLGWQSSSRVRRTLSRPGFAWLRSKNMVVEPHFHYWAGLSEASRNCYMLGYWQSPKYFAKHASIIRSEFDFKPIRDHRNARIAKQIGEVNAVSVHVRRGDFVNSQVTNEKHGVCSIEYYRDATRYLLERVESPHFFIFSDDIEWAKENLLIEAPRLYVDHNVGANSYIDMYLMSLCQHNIIANSSFSWWAAWLNKHVDKIVLAPGKWFLHPINTADLLPEDWLKL